MADQIGINVDDLRIIWQFLDKHFRENVNMGNMYFPENTQLRDIYERLTQALRA
jgi:hypothetical protein